MPVLEQLLVERRNHGADATELTLVKLLDKNGTAPDYRQHPKANPVVMPGRKEP